MQLIFFPPVAFSRILFLNVQQNHVNDSFLLHRRLYLVESNGSDERLLQELFHMYRLNNKQLNSHFVDDQLCNEYKRFCFLDELFEEIQPHEKDFRLEDY